MKYLNRLFLSIMLVAIFTACQKEQTVKEHAPPTALIEKSDNMDAYLTEFKTRMRSELKSEEFLSLEDARWHLSAMLNFSYADANPHYKHFRVDSFYTVFPLSNMMVSMADINAAFSTFTVDLVNTYQAIQHDDKTLIIVATQVAGQNGSEAQIRMVSTFAYNPETTSFQFGETDWWYWGANGHDGFGAGKCGPYIGQQVGKDAAVVLTQKLNMSIAIPIGRIYYTGEEIVEVHPNQYQVPYQNHPYNRFSLLFWQLPYPNQPDPEWSCLCPDEMNYYLSNIKYIIMPDHKPVGKIISSYFIESDLLLGGSVYWLHKAHLKYGIQHVTVIPPEL